MTFLDNPLAEAILIELRRIATAGERTATAYERALKLAESKGSRAATTASPDSGAEPTKRRAKTDPKDILTVTGYVLHFGQAVNAATNEPKLTKKNREYWVLKLTNSFIANVFSESQAAICSKAYDDQRPLIVDYVKDGQYSNIESVKLAASAPATEQRQSREPGEDDSNSPF